MTVDDTKPCPVCGETIKAAALKCRFCGTDLAALEADREAAVEKPLFSGHPAPLYSAGRMLIAVLTLGVGYLYYWLQSRTLTYHVTTQRVILERGLLSKTKESVELFRVDDLSIDKPFLMRLAGYCRLTLRSSDRTFPTAVLTGIPDLETLADTLRDCALRERTRRRMTTIVEA